MSEVKNNAYTQPEQMYADNDLGTHPLFPGGFINFGYWENFNPSDRIKLVERIASQVALYDRVLDPVTTEPGANLLEVGYGKGYGAMLAVYDHNAASVTGVDASAQQVERSRNIIKGNLVGRIAIEHAKAEHLPFNDESFDGVYSVEAIQHFKLIGGFFSEAFRVLRTDSTLSFCTFYATDENAASELKQRIQTYRDGLDTVLVSQPLQNDLENAGFKDIKLESIGANVWPGFTQWSYQVRPEDRWPDVAQWLDAYNEGLLDYGIFTANKA